MTRAKPRRWTVEYQVRSSLDMHGETKEEAVQKVLRALKFLPEVQILTVYPADFGDDEPERSAP